MPKPKILDKRQQPLFEIKKPENLEENPNWELPILVDEQRISLDTETTGLKLWKGDKPIGLSIATEDLSRSWYIPWGHATGFNFDFDKVKEWAKDQLYGKDIDLINAKFDHNMLLNVGIDISEYNDLHDVMHPPALLYPHRQDLDLNSLALSELGKRKIELDGDFNKFPMQERNSAAVSYYAKYDALLTAELARHYAPKIASAGLQDVLDLEDALIPCVAHMERQGARIDADRLLAWQKQLHSRYVQLILKIYSLTSIRCEPTKATDLAKLFTVCKLRYSHTDTGLPSITNEVLLQHLNIEPVRLAYEARQIKSLESRAIKKFAESIDNDLIRYSLNQLKASNTEGSVGAITGRFSSSGGGKEINGVNIQQVMDDEKQEKIASISDFPIRDLFLPTDGMYWLSADAMQIEFRLFAHYSQSRRLLSAYKENPLIDFHDYVKDHIIKRPDFPRKIIKNLNFGKLYGLGINKLANIYLKCSYEEAKESSDLYNREFPEARELMDDVIRIVAQRGWCKTILGRRHTFGPGIDERYYAALNYIIQGSAADIMKKKLLDLWNTRKETGFNMRFTVHDEVDGDIPGLPEAQKVKEILDTPAFDKLTVPILWDVGIGETWKRVKSL